MNLTRILCLAVVLSSFILTRGSGQPLALPHPGAFPALPQPGATALQVQSSAPEQAPGGVLAPSENPSQFPPLGPAPWGTGNAAAPLPGTGPAMAPRSPYDPVFNPIISKADPAAQQQQQQQQSPYTNMQTVSADSNGQVTTYNSNTPSYNNYGSAPSTDGSVSGQQGTQQGQQQNQQQGQQQGQQQQTQQQQGQQQQGQQQQGQQGNGGYVQSGATNGGQANNNGQQGTGANNQNQLPVLNVGAPSPSEVAAANPMVKAVELAHQQVQNAPQFSFGQDGATIQQPVVTNPADGVTSGGNQFKVNEYGVILGNATEEGLTDAEAKIRLSTYGPNKLPQITWDVVMVQIAAICAGQSHPGPDSRTGATGQSPEDGQIQTIEAVGLVPGDIVIVRLGDIAPADVKLLGTDDEHDQPLQVDQAALTGESLPSKKGPGDVVFGGSTIKQGERHAVVYATGPNTFFGRSAALISGVHNVPNIQKIMTKIGACCLITIFIWVVIELAVQFGGYHHHCDISGAGHCPTLLNVLVIIVGGIPIAMPTVLSVTLALGSYKLASEGAIVARMSAVEEIAGTDILCSDKTGTLTLNQLTINNEAIYTLPGHSLDEVLRLSALSADTHSEEAIDMVMRSCCPDKDMLVEKYDQIKFVPFNPVDKYTVAIVMDKEAGSTFRILKGAPQVVLRMAHGSAEIEADVKRKIDEFAGRGFRALGLALSEGGSGQARWEMVALLPMYDPPRHDTRQTIESCIEKGIQVKMVTGDQLLIGKETAKQLGMGTNMYTTDELLHGDKKGDDSAELFVEEADGFAEVFPEHKFRIVEMLQNRRHTVAMTGDGVNDAPALKKADVGIAVAGATDAARGAADIVLTEPGLSTIVTAVIGARKIFQRMTTYAKYTVAMTFRICFTFGILTIAYNWYFPTLLIVLMAVFNDGAMIALSKDRVVASRTPNRWNLPSIFAQGARVTVLDQCRWEQYYVRNSITRSLIYNYVSISGQALVFVVRTASYSLCSRAGLYTYLAFFGAQASIASTLIAIFGFGGYPFPSNRVQGCRFCTLSTGGGPPFFEHKAPVAFTESGSTDSTIGCTYYVIVAWIWAALFYLGLDPIKFAMMWISNEEGFRDRSLFFRKRRRPAAPEVTEEEAMGAMTEQSHVVQPTYQNALGRASLGRISEAQLRRATVVLIDEHGRPLPRPAALDPSSPRGAQADKPGSPVERLRRVSMELASKIT
ncbi:plasma-membrane proton-e [Coccomyxa subellipsoidea C-169]|uniref:P-type H(+)-exporting transporter n=1 Tax=Coccomyxa subellipsoidea (strain C-169) TaxID=574566 RepID=I0YLC0_COCSC|nr:plasma-membrane proton-e [Coccomyxa subellipsoidea C-169]EIE19189.1 plasma-membrane proton-e [Coccomyxa subellipsoidea C-169]|eukprot:XP_005643733.1 plasma-membrane proton-e [Coccomyxa subellipsoidea C-169]